MKNKKLTMMRILSLTIMILTTIWLSKSNAYTDYQCVGQCTARGLLYDSCVEKCSDTPQRDTLGEHVERGQDQNQREFERIMREQNRNSGGRSAFEVINGR